jgi:hypothetical protein
VVSTLEMVAALIVSALALLAPLIAVAVVVLICWLTVYLVRRYLRAKTPRAS